MIFMFVLQWWRLRQFSIRWSTSTLTVPSSTGKSCDTFNSQSILLL